MKIFKAPHKKKNIMVY